MTHFRLVNTAGISLRPRQLHYRNFSDAYNKVHTGQMTASDWRSSRLVRLIFLTCLVNFSLLGVMASSSVSDIVSSSLLTKLQNGEKSSAVIKMSRETKEVLNEIEKQQFASRDERANAVTAGLQALANESQKEIKAYLDGLSPSVEYKSFWISNSLVVKDADLKIIEDIVAIGGVKEIREEQTVHIMNQN